MEMFSCSPTLVRSDFQRTVVQFLENLISSQEQFFSLQTLFFYGISYDSSKHFKLRTCEHMIHGRLRMRARQTKNEPLTPTPLFDILSVYLLTIIAPL